MDSIGNTKTLVFIKPTEGSIYQDFIDVLDVVQIHKISQYVVSEPNQIEKSIISKSN